MRRETANLLGVNSGLALFVVVLLAGCASTGRPPAGEDGIITGDEIVRERTVMTTKDLYAFEPDTGMSGEAPEPAPAPASVVAYHVGPGDTLDFRFYDDETLSKKVIVRYDGCVSLPLVDDVCLQDMTRKEAEEAVRKAYEVVFREPHLSLTIDEVLSKYYFVFGQVTQPDRYAYDQPLVVLDAINRAGGVRTDDSDSFIGAQGQLIKALIIRHVDGEREVIECDLRGIAEAGAHASDTPVWPGDVVFVPEGLNLVYVLGEVPRPDVYPLVEGMTVLEALARAGGPLERTSRMRNIVLLRSLDENRTEAQLLDAREMLRTGVSPRLQAGDIIYVPRDRLTTLADYISRFSNVAASITPIMDMYIRAYDTYYIDQVYDKLLDQSQNGVIIGGSGGGLRR